MNIRIDIFNEEQFNIKDWPPENAAEFVSWFNEKLAMIPEEFSSSAKIEVEAVPSYEGSAYSSIEIYYYRPETEKELYDRGARELSRQNSIKEKELRQLEELKKKYT